MCYEQTDRHCPGGQRPGEHPAGAGGGGEDHRPGHRGSDRGRQPGGRGPRQRPPGGDHQQRHGRPAEGGPQPGPHAPVRVRGHEPSLYRLRPAERLPGGAAQPGDLQHARVLHRHPGGGGPRRPRLPEPLQAHRQVHDQVGGGGLCRQDRLPGQGGRRPGLAALCGLPQAQAHHRGRRHPGPQRGRAPGHLLRRRRHPRLPHRAQPPEGRGGGHRQGLRLGAPGGAAGRGYAHHPHRRGEGGHQLPHGERAVALLHDPR